MAKTVIKLLIERPTMEDDSRLVSFPTRVSRPTASFPDWKVISDEMSHTNTHAHVPLILFPHVTCFNETLSLSTPSLPLPVFQSEVGGDQSAGLTECEFLFYVLIFTQYLICRRWRYRQRPVCLQSMACASSQLLFLFGSHRHYCAVL